MEKRRIHRLKNKQVIIAKLKPLDIKQIKVEQEQVRVEKELRVESIESVTPELCV